MSEQESPVTGEGAAGRRPEPHGSSGAVPEAAGGVSAERRHGLPGVVSEAAEDPVAPPPQVPVSPPPLALFTVPAPVSPPPRPPRRNRRALRAVHLWAAAVTVFALVGTATAYGIAGLERTDVPGLATESDGRWDFPQLTKPPLPPGSPGPFAEDNRAGTHYADLRALVLPAPRGAEEDKALRGSDGWLAVEKYLAEYEREDREELGQKLVDTGLRHIAARGWTTPDGTRTRIYLLQFGTANVVETEVASDAVAFTTPNHRVRGSGKATYDQDFPEAAAVPGISRTAYVEARPFGAEQVRQAYLSAGDVYAVILQSRKGGVRMVPFQQTVVLQSQLLG